MKTKFLKSFFVAFLLLTILSFENASAQIIEISPFAGYQLGGKANLYEGEFNIDNAMSYGGRLAVGLSTTTFVEFTYLRSDTEGQLRYGGTFGTKTPLSSNYIQLGGLQEMDMGIISPFLSLAGGLAVWSPKNSGDFDTYTQFAFSFGGGTKIWITDNIGIRLQATMLMPLVWDGAGFGCGIGTGGSGCSGGVYTRITPFQGEFSGGLVIKIKPGS